MALHICSGRGALSNPPSLQEAEAGVVAAVGMPLVSTAVPSSLAVIDTDIGYHGIADNGLPLSST